MNLRTFIISPGPAEQRKATLWMSGLCAVAAAVVFWRFRELRHDDAFITFQYARNLATGNGFVFNPGERVLGTTSPLHALLMALGYLLVGDASLPSFAVGLGAIGLGFQGLFVFLLLKERSLPLACIAAALVLCGFSDGLAFLALETNVFAALVLACVWSLTSRRAVLCGVTLGAAFLLRYDAALLVPVIAVSWWLRWRELPRVVLAVSFAVVAPWLLWATWYFGSFLPQTFFAKQQITPTGPYLAHYAEFFAGSPARVLIGWENGALRASSSVVAVAGVFYVARHLRALLPFFAFAVLLTLAYGVMGPHFLQHWHLYSALLAFQLAFVLGIFGWGMEWLAKERAERLRAAAFVVTCVLGAAFTLRTVAVQLVPSQQVVHSFWLGERDARYQQVAQWVREHVRGDRSFLALEVGTLGYYSRLRMIDPYGLINATNAYPRDPTVENLLALIDQYQPDVLLVNTPEQGALLERARSFRMVKVFSTDPWSTVLIRGPETLAEPARLDELRAALPQRAIDELKR